MALELMSVSDGCGEWEIVGFSGLWKNNVKIGVFFWVENEVIFRGYFWP